ncbi:MAG: hypothetical protein ACK4GN_11525 [Runella sp.]
MLEIPVNIGTNAPRQHQRIIRKLTSGLDRLYVAGEIPFEPFPETMVDESQTSATPDVLLYDNLALKNVVIIEVAAAGWNKDFRKIMEIVEDYEIEEGFVYNYEKQVWRKYKRGEGEISENPSFCDSIGYDLNDFLK